MRSDIIQEDLQNIIRELGKEIYKLEGKNILITGASGMLAGYLARTIIFANEKLFQKKAQLYLVLRRKIRPFGNDHNIHYIYRDIGKSLPKLTNIDYIIHAASPAAPKIYTKDQINTLNANILGLYNLLSIVDKKTQSFLYFSSAEIYGNIDHLNERSSYVQAKKICETICMNYYWEAKLPVKIVRIFHTFGPGLNLGDGRIFSDFIKDGLNGNNIQIKGDKTLKRSFLYLKDATIMFFKILLSDINGEIYDIGNSKNNLSVYKTAEIVAATFNSSRKNKIKVVISTDSKNSYYKNAPKNAVPDISKFVERFGYQPSTNTEEAFRRTISFLLANE